MVAQNDLNKILSNFLLQHFFPYCLEKLKNGKKWFVDPKIPKKSEFFWNQPFFKLQTSMITQNDRNKILSKFFATFCPGYLEKLKNGKKRVFTPKMHQKIEHFLKSSMFQATDIYDSSKWPQ